MKFTYIRLEDGKTLNININQIAWFDLNTRMISMSNGDTFCVDDESAGTLIKIL